MSALIVEPDIDLGAPPPPVSAPTLIEEPEGEPQTDREPALPPVTGLFPPSARRAPGSMLEIQDVVCGRYKVKRADLIGSGRHKHIAHARHVAMYLCKKLLPVSFPDVGRAFGNRDHTTVMSAVKSVEMDVAKDPTIRVEVDALLAEIGAAPTEEPPSAEVFNVAFLEGENRRLLRRLSLAEGQRAEAERLRVEAMANVHTMQGRLTRLTDTLTEAQTVAAASVARVTVLEETLARTEAEAEADARFAVVERARVEAQARASALTVKIGAGSADLEALRAAPVAAKSTRAHGRHVEHVGPVQLELLPPPVPTPAPASAPELPPAPPPVPATRPPRAAAPALPEKRSRTADAPTPRPERRTPAPTPTPRPAPACPPVAKAPTSPSPNAFAAKPLDEVREPRDYFRCGRWQSTIAAEDCARRHELATSSTGGANSSKTRAHREKRALVERCDRCDIGKRMETLIKLTRKPKAKVEAPDAS